MKKIQFACVSDHKNQSSSNFAVSMLRLQQMLIQRNDISCMIYFENDINEILNNFNKSEANQLLVIDTMMGFDVNFVIKAIEDNEHDFIVGIYPLTIISWDNIKNKMLAGGSKEHIRHMGNEYNVDTQNIKNVDYKKKLLTLTNIEHLKIFRITQNVLHTIIDKYGSEISYGNQYHFYCEIVNNNKKYSKDANFVRMYGEDIYADYESSNGNFGSMNFEGCVSLRETIR